MIDEFYKELIYINRILIIIALTSNNRFNK